MIAKAGAYLLLLIGVLMGMGGAYLIHVGLGMLLTSAGMVHLGRLIIVSRS